MFKASFSVLFADEKQAKQAKQTIESGALESTRAKIVLAVKKSALNAEITASDFTALRALSTSFLRDVKVVLDSFNAIKGEANGIK